MELLSILVFFLFILSVYIFRAPIVKSLLPKMFNLNVLLSAFFIIGVVFSFLYFLIDLGFNFFDGTRLFDGKINYEGNLLGVYLDTLYFSFISQLTVGYGDIHPAHPISKVLSLVQGILGAVFMGGLIAALIEKSKSSLNYLYISEVNFFHCDAQSNHGHEIFSLNLKLSKTTNSLFDNFKVTLIAEYDDDKEFRIFCGNNDAINSADIITLDISQKNKYPRFIAINGKLMFETFNPTGNNPVGSPQKFSIPLLMLRYEYSYESRMYCKDLPIENTSSIAAVISSQGRNETGWVKYAEK